MAWQRTDGTLAVHVELWSSRASTHANNVFLSSCHRAAGLPNQQLPIAEFDGKVLAQTVAILRFVGRLGREYFVFVSWLEGYAVSLL